MAPAVLDDNKYECLECLKQHRAAELMAVESGPAEPRDYAMAKAGTYKFCGECHWCARRSQLTIQYSSSDNPFAPFEDAMNEQLNRVAKLPWSTK